MNRSEHLEWCKTRALEYISIGDITNAWKSILSDLNKHRLTKNHTGIELGTMLMANGNLSSISEMKEFINEFN